MSSLPNPVPMVTSTTARFWKATTEGRFELQRCGACGVVVWFPKKHCPECWSDSLTTFNASGKGSVYSFTIIRKVANEYKQATPFVVAYVELEEGPRVMTNIVDCDVESVAVGMPVEMVFHDTGEGSALYRFRPIS